MKIGIYKPLKKIFWTNTGADYNVWSREIIGLTKILADNGHTIELLSDNDYDNTYDGIINNCKAEYFTELDVLVIFNGAFSLTNETEEEIIKKYPHKKLILIASDLDLAVKEHNFDLYDKVLTAGPQPLKGESNSMYGAVEHYHMYGEKLEKNGWESRKNEGIFIGMARHKEELFMEYVWRPNINFYGRADTLLGGINKQIDRDTAYNLLKSHIYSIVFFDKRVTDIGFVTARPLELVLKGVIPFLDKYYDKDKIQFDERFDFLRCDNYEDFYKKTQTLNKETYNQIMEMLRTWFEEEVLNGETAYTLFMEGINNGN